MTDRVRLLLEDGTVLAEGVRPVTEYEAISGETFDSSGDGYDLSFIAPTPIPQSQFDAFEKAMRELGVRMHDLYYSGYNAVFPIGGDE